ncbi:MAG: glycine betaine ABC transporter substrate-binding protein [Arenicella sp.]
MNYNQKKEKFAQIFMLILGLLLCSYTVHAQTIRVGGKDFTEQIILSELTAQYLEEKGFKVDLERGLGPSGGLRKALVDGNVDVYWEYIGTAYLNFLKKSYKGESSDVVYLRVKSEDSKKGIVWLNKSEANDTYALAMNASVAEEKGIRTLEDLSKYQNTVGGLTFATDPTWYSRDDGLVPLEEKYGFKFVRDGVQRIEFGLIYKLLGKKEVDVGLVYSTDGRIVAQGLRVLRDTKNFFPPYQLTPVIRQDVLLKYPKLADYLNELSAVLDTNTITQLNSRVDVDRVQIWETVEEFLISKGMLDGL